MGSNLYKRRGVSLHFQRQMHCIVSAGRRNLLHVGLFGGDIGKSQVMKIDFHRSPDLKASAHFPRPRSNT
jgi:hypothetical protein